MSCFIFRIPRTWEYFSDGSWKFKFVRDELIKNYILYQGWGIEDLRKGTDAYVAEWLRRKWSDSSTPAKKRFKILAPMLNVKVGDLIVIPKLSINSHEDGIGKYFTVVICSATYDFSFPHNISERDFGHFFKVEPKMATYDYDSSNPHAKFIGNIISQPGYNPYNYAFHQVDDLSFENAVQALKP